MTDVVEAMGLAIENQMACDDNTPADLARAAIRECRPPEGAPRCWFCGTGPGPICDACIDAGDDVLNAHFARDGHSIAEPPHE